MSKTVLSALLAAMMVAGSFLALVTGVSGLEEIAETEIFELTEDPDEDGKINSLVIGVPIENISRLGASYYMDWIEVHGQLWNENQSVYLFYTVEEYMVDTSDQPESDIVYLEFSGRLINYSGIDGPYCVLIEVMHYVAHPLAPYMPYISEYVGSTEYITEAYLHDDFEPPEPYEVASSEWEVLDEDGDGRYDILRTNVSVDSINREIVTVYAELLPEEGPELARQRGDAVLEAGTGQILQVDFDARLLNGFGMDDESYRVYVQVSTSDGYDDWGWVLTDPFDASDFDDYPVRMSENRGWTVVDIDDDGLVDIMKVEFNVTSDASEKCSITATLLNSAEGLVSHGEFQGYLIAGQEQTIMLQLELTEAYSMEGDFEIEVEESPLAFGKWPGYEYIQAISLGNVTDDPFDTGLVNHPRTLSLSGTVLDSGGDPVEGVSVSCISINETWFWVEANLSTSDADGEFEIDGLVPGRATITVQEAGFFNMSVMIPDFFTNVTDLVITLEEDTPRDCTIEGTVRYSDGEPVPGSEVTAYRPGTGAVCDSTTDAGGTYSIDVKEGEYMLVAFDIGTELPYYLGLEHIVVESGNVVNVEIVLDIEVDLDEVLREIGVTESLSFEDWNSVDMHWTLDYGSNSYWEYYGLVSRVNADWFYGDGDGYADDEEMAYFAESFASTSTILALGASWPTELLPDMYMLESFCVDGIGYSAPSEDLLISTSNLSGGVFDEVGDISCDMDLEGADAYWPVEGSDVHRLYMEVDYDYADLEAPSNPYPSKVTEVRAPDGYILSWTNEPENISVEGVSDVVITPGGPPDPEGNSSTLLILEFTLATSDSLGAVHGVATLEDGVDHSGIQVDLLDPALDEVGSTATPSNGEFAFPDLEPGDYWVRASADGYNDAFTQVTVEAGILTEVELVLAVAEGDVENGSLSGVVLTEAGLAIVGATVDAFSPADGSTVAATVGSDSEGEFNLTDLTPGEYRVVVSADGFDDATIYLLLGEGEDRSLGEIVLASDSPVGYIFGTVEDINGNPVEGILVEVREYGSEIVQGDCLTDADGGFMVVGLADGHYNLTLSLNGTELSRTGVEVVDFVGDAGVITVDLSEGEHGSDTESQPLWPWILLAAIVAVVVAVVALLMLRRPGKPEPSEAGPTEPAPADQM